MSPRQGAVRASRRRVISAMLLREDDSPETWDWSFFGLIRASRTALIWHTTRFRHKLLRLAHTPLERTTASTEQHAECAICFEDLCAQPIVIFEKKRGLRRRIFRRPARRNLRFGKASGPNPGFPGKKPRSTTDSAIENVAETRVLARVS